MFRAILRLVSMVLLSVAVIMAVLDATRSIAAEAIVLTPLGTSWAAVSPETLNQLKSAIDGSMPAFVWNEITAGFLALPGFAIFAGLAILFALAGHGRTRKDSRLAARR